MSTRALPAIPMSIWIVMIASLALAVTGPRAQARPTGLPPLVAKDCPSACRVETRAWARPGLLLAGEQATVTLRIAPACIPFDQPLRLVLAVDGSARLDRHELEAVRTELERLILRLDLPNNPSTRVALVDDGDGGRTLVPLSGDADRLRARLSRIEAEGEPQVPGVLAEAWRLLLQAGRAECEQRRANEIVVLYSAELERGECAEAQRAARAIKRAGIRLITVDATTPPRDARCLRDLASSARYFYHIDNAGGLIQVFERIRDEVINISLRQLVVVESLDPSIPLVPDSHRPPAELDPEAGTLTWRQNFVPREGVTFTYRVQPGQIGLQPLSRGARVEWRDNYNLAGQVTVEPAWAQVFAPAARQP